MENFIFSVNTMAPVCLVVALGYLLRKKGFFSEDFLSCLDRYVFKVALPCMMFSDVAQSDIRSDFSLGFVLFCAGATTVMFMGLFALCRIFIKDKFIIGAFVQGSARGSIAVLGAAFAKGIYGSAGMVPLMLAVAVPLNNIYTVITLSLNSVNKANFKSQFKTTIKGIAENPLIIGILLGIICSVYQVKLPMFLSKSISSVAATGTPMALLSLGGALQLQHLSGKKSPAFIACLFKLIIFPAIFVPLAVHLGYTHTYLIAILFMSASPTSVIGYVMAKNMDNDYALTSMIVVLSTIFSCFTITAWLYILKSLALI